MQNWSHPCAPLPRVCRPAGGAVAAAPSGGVRQVRLAGARADPKICTAAWTLRMSGRAGHGGRDLERQPQPQGRQRLQAVTAASGCTSAH